MVASALGYKWASGAVRRCLLVVTMLVCSGQTLADEIRAQAAVDTYIRDLLQSMDAIKPLYQSDRAAYFAEVEAALSEFVDFKEVARGVMARYSTGANGATNAQLERFADVFRESLIDFYGSALANYGGVDFEITAVNAQSEDPENNTNVRMNIRADNGTRFEVMYTMFLNEDRIWKLKNLYVEGVNLRRQYHSQFDSLMASHNYDIDKVIDAWKSSQ
jgi:phospholipid transport system substrate-binding protein